MGDDVELPELPEPEKEKEEKEERRDHLNTLVAITVTLLVTFMAMCKITDNNIVLHMQQAQADKVDKWSWMQALNIREEILQSRLDEVTAPSMITDYKAKAQKIANRKEEVKKDATEDEKRYSELDERHEHFDYTEGAISLAVSLLAMTTLLSRRWMYAVSLIPAALGVVEGVLGFLG